MRLDTERALAPGTTKNHERVAALNQELENPTALVSVSPRQLSNLLHMGAARFSRDILNQGIIVPEDPHDPRHYLLSGEQFSKLKAAVAALKSR